MIFVVLLILSISVCLAFSEKTLEYKVYSNKFFYVLEKFSLPICLLHIFIRVLLQNLSFIAQYNYLQIMSVYLLGTIVLSYIVMINVEKTTKKNLLTKFFKSLFLTKQESKI